MKFRYILSSLALIITLFACKQEEVQGFIGEAGVVFMSYNSITKDWEHSATYLKRDINFFSEITEEKFPVDFVEVPMRVGIEGKTPTKDLRVKFRAEAIKDQEQLEVELPQDVVVKAGTSYAEFKLKVYNPGSDKGQSLRFIVDYANSDVVAGLKDRQEFIFTGVDIAIKSYEDYGVTEEQYIETFERHLGKYGSVKHRFLISVTKTIPEFIEQKIETPAETFRYRVAYSTLVPSNPNYGLPGSLEHYRKALREYNSKHESPLAEADGTPVTLPEETNTQP